MRYLNFKTSCLILIHHHIYDRYNVLKVRHGVLNLLHVIWAKSHIFVLGRKMLVTIWLISKKNIRIGGMCGKFNRKSSGIHENIIGDSWDGSCASPAPAQPNPAQPSPAWRAARSAYNKSWSGIHVLRRVLRLRSDDSMMYFLWVSLCVCVYSLCVRGFGVPEF